MSRLPQMEYRTEVLRGWPKASNVQSNSKTDDATLTNGDLVLPTAGDKVKRCDKANAVVGVGLVVRGPVDDKSVRAAGGVADGTKNGIGRAIAGGGNTCIVLWGNYKIRTVAFDDTQTYVPGDGVVASADGVFTKATGDAAIGFVEAIDNVGEGKKALVIVVA